ncbi:hypothetical protein BDV26DRAFT_34714 [Aspergillus bertholletiae]|uniref:Uncharacterized protein n=1 Tax=Aspergillus bertholletiae TaxID=1226010 RepID=A0A5N7AXX9_9EURO|nr:hypothetical protein BDV26DRAFT_34714 [Aspergillus bertholletiae]
MTFHRAEHQMVPELYQRGCDWSPPSRRILSPSCFIPGAPAYRRIHSSYIVLFRWWLAIQLTLFNRCQPSRSFLAIQSTLWDPTLLLSEPPQFSISVATASKHAQKPWSWRWPLGERSNSHTPDSPSFERSAIALRQAEWPWCDGQQLIYACLRSLALRPPNGDAPLILATVDRTRSTFLFDSRYWDRLSLQKKLDSVLGRCYRLCYNFSLRPAGPTKSTSACL